jgi:hypothetical protein
VSHDSVRAARRLGLITLNRPKALNALTHAMCLAMKAQLDEWARDAAIEGGRHSRRRRKARSVPAAISARSTNPARRERLMRSISIATNTFSTRRSSIIPKPYIALIRGIVMGGGVGVSVHGSHRVADETPFRHAGNRASGFSRCRRKLFPAALSGRDRHVSRADRRAAEDGRRVLCRRGDAFCSGKKCGSADRIACGGRAPDARSGPAKQAPEAAACRSIAK